MRTLLPLVLAAALGPAIAQEPAVVPLGSVVAAPFTDLRWQTRSLRELGDRPATVIFFTTLECPLVQRYLPRLGELARDYASKGVVTLLMNVGPGDGFVDAVGQVADQVPQAVFGKDFELAFARACGVDRTAAALVLDHDGRIAYRGRVDDQYGYTGSRQRPTRDDLRLALEDVLAGRPVAVAETAISGCKITPPAAVAGDAALTYTRDVAPILQRHCSQCHRPGGEAPFALLDEAAVKKHAEMIAETVVQGRMPPWYASTAHGAFANHRGLGTAERDVVLAWVRGGMASGDPKHLPPPPLVPPPGFRIGEPDLVLSLKAPVRLPEDGIVPYQYFILPHRFEQDTWVEAIEILPDNKRVLHHCNLARVKWGEKFSQQGFITGYVPGGDPMVLDAGSAIRIPAGTVLALQAHYVTTGQPEVDRIRVGLRFPRQPVQKEVKIAIVADFKFEIPPGAMAQRVAATRTLPEDAVGIGMFVHMHLRGRDMKVLAELPGGDKETLLLVPNYNFDWQQSYRWAPGARTFAKGTRLKAIAHFDNSKWNPFNPEPEATVRFGLETTDEMMYLFLFWMAQHEQLGLDVDPATGCVRG